MWLEKEGFVYGMVNPRKMHRFEPDLGENERALDRIKTDEMDSFRIAMYCEKHCRKIRSQPSRLPAPAYFKLKRLIAERRQYVVQSALYKQQLHDVCDYDTDSSVSRKPTGIKHEKLEEYLVQDFMALKEGDEHFKGYDAVFFIAGIRPDGRRC